MKFRRFDINDLSEVDENYIEYEISKLQEK